MDENGHRDLDHYLGALQTQAMIFVLAFIPLYKFSNMWRLLLVCYIILYFYWKILFEHFVHKGFASFVLYWMCVYNWKL